MVGRSSADPRSFGRFRGLPVANFEPKQRTEVEELCIITKIAENHLCDTCISGRNTSVSPQLSAEQTGKLSQSSWKLSPVTRSHRFPNKNATYNGCSTAKSRLVAWVPDFVSCNINFCSCGFQAASGRISDRMMHMSVTCTRLGQHQL